MLSALIVQWLGHLVVAEKTWVRFPLGAHNTGTDAIGSVITNTESFFRQQHRPELVDWTIRHLLRGGSNTLNHRVVL